MVSASRTEKVIFEQTSAGRGSGETAASAKALGFQSSSISQETSWSRRNKDVREETGPVAHHGILALCSL